MAGKKKKVRPIKGPGRDKENYREFADDLLKGNIKATKLYDTTVPDGTEQIAVSQFDVNGDPLPDEIVTIDKRKLTDFSYEDPDDP